MLRMNLKHVTHSVSGVCHSHTVILHIVHRQSTSLQVHQQPCSLLCVLMRACIFVRCVARCVTHSVRGSAHPQAAKHSVCE